MSQVGLAEIRGLIYKNVLIFKFNLKLKILHNGVGTFDS